MGRNGKKAELIKAEEDSAELDRFTVGLPPDLAEKVRKASDKHHVSQQTVLRNYVRAGEMMDDADEVIIKKDGKEFLVLPWWR